MAITANNSRQRRQTRDGLSLAMEKEEASRTAVAKGPELAAAAPVKMHRPG